jgi:radical SAM-linked protein
VIRLRIRFAKLGKVRWTSHRDVARMWERAFRRLNLPLAYSAGFSPRPKVSFGLALPTGHESVAEYLDVELLEEPAGIEGLAETLSGALPTGVDALAVLPLEGKVPSLQEDVTSCSWQFVVAPTETGGGVEVEDLRDRVAALLAAEAVEVTRQRKGQAVTDDIRPGVIAVDVLGPAPDELGPGVLVEAELTTQPRSIRPSELIAALDQLGMGGARLDVSSQEGGNRLEERHVRRLHQWIAHDGARREPVVLPAGTTGLVLPGGVPVATCAPHTVGCAS